MIQSYKDDATRDIYNGEDTKEARRFVNIAGVAKRKLDMIHAATNLKDLTVPPGNRLEALSGKLAGYHSIRINDQYRIIFRFEGGNAYEVEISDHYRP